MPSATKSVNGGGSPATTNRGPAAAAKNRAAILDAARRLFGADGYHIPFSAIARAAGYPRP